MKNRGYQNGAARGGARAVAPPPSPAQRTLARGLEHHQAGRFADAETLYRSVLTLEPSNAAALHLLGALMNQCGQYEAAIPFFVQAITIEPLAASYHNNLGVTYQSLGRYDEAVACYGRALALQPDHVDALNNQGVMLQALGRREEALASFERSLKLRPNSPETLNNIGGLLSHLGRLEEADVRLRRALKLRPNYPEALITLAGGLLTRGLKAEAVAAATQAVAIAPNDPRTHDVLGSVLRWNGRLEESIASYERALQITPNAASTWLNIAGALQVAGRTADAAAGYRRSLSLDPTSPVAHSGLIFMLDLTAGAIEDARAERRRYNQRFGQTWRDRSSRFPNSRDPERRLRVGYVSGDFYHHSAAMTFMPILRAHDHAQVQVYCYSGATTVDAITLEAQTLADVWRDVAYLTDDELEAQIRADEIDVLMDLSGHSSGNRLPVFARRPAPIQLTAWGYATGTGMDAIDGFLVDRVSVPPEEEAHYAERIVAVPSAICFEPPPAAPEVNALPALSRGYVTFGAFNRLPKVSAETRATWAQVLLAVPSARLVIKTGAQDSEVARQQLVDDLVARGIGRERIELRGSTSRLEHLAAHNDVDLILDSFPHVGGITSVEALLMGVPVVTLLGEGVAERLSGSFLTALGLEELVATTPEQYVSIAQAAACRLPWLAEQRRTLRARLLASPTGDTRAYTRAVEDAYRGLWRAWCTRPGDQGTTHAPTTSAPEHDTAQDETTQKDTYTTQSDLQSPSN